ncbi:hypothetical protein BGZ63DRAFT_393898 [Mariannaea sp. PMI_226]|nr:hypothetical protein BGZ63DRAFT_393898 [Mariannaea sp. PMI_226]
MRRGPKKKKGRKQNQPVLYYRQFPPRSHRNMKLAMELIPSRFRSFVADHTYRSPKHPSPVHVVNDGPAHRNDSTTYILFIGSASALAFPYLTLARNKMETSSKRAALWSSKAQPVSFPSSRRYLSGSSQGEDRRKRPGRTGPANSGTGLQTIVHGEMVIIAVATSQ